LSPAEGGKPWGGKEKSSQRRRGERKSEEVTRLNIKVKSGGQEAPPHTGFVWSLRITPKPVSRV